MDDRESPTNSMMKSAASLMMDDDIHEIEEGANTSTNASPRPSCITPGRQALADSIIESVKASVSKLRRGDRPTIYIVPQRIREVKEVAYEPKMVSIGPYHHGKKRLQAMEEHKLLYLHSFLSRNPNHRLEDYLKAMEELEDKARSCYSDNIGPNEFVKMMVLDACFIIELFLRLFPREQIEELFRQQRDLSPLPEVPEFFFHSDGFEDPIFDMTGTVEYTVSDTLLFENQIPFFVLQRIFIMACPANVPHLLAKMAHYLFDGFMARNKKIEIKDSYHHLLHLFHLHLLPTPTIRKEVPNLSLTIYEPREMIPCATDLQHAGVKFKKNEKSNNILNVKFSNGVLEITPFVIHDQSDTLFRNLIAFEQCCLESKFHVFTTYTRNVTFSDERSYMYSLKKICSKIAGSSRDGRSCFFLASHFPSIISTGTLNVSAL
ncbi:UPF0481 protein At3g47200-like [Magnolia sinica]|uniref:UPF0481 protein At3g47200-like n=1 Tax=Magnolia sinica TaxID=86752 RepID=UPI00265B670D|nr:UPF0481 protein At3g47200-like [Magnolia sinica]